LESRGIFPLGVLNPEVDLLRRGAPVSWEKSTQVSNELKPQLTLNGMRRGVYIVYGANGYMGLGPGDARRQFRGRTSGRRAGCPGLHRTPDVRGGGPDVRAGVDAPRVLSGQRRRISGRGAGCPGRAWPDVRALAGCPGPVALAAVGLLWVNAQGPDVRARGPDVRVLELSSALLDALARP